MLKAETNTRGHGWIASATSTALNHLRVCALINENVRSTAEEMRASKYASDSPTSRRRRRADAADMLQPSMPSISFNAPGPSPMAGPSMIPNRPQDYEWGGSSARRSPSLQYSSRNSPAPSESGSSYSNSRALSRSNSFSAQYHVPIRQSSTMDPGLHWSREKQKSFDTHIARMTASAGFPLSWVDNAEWIDFCTEFLPAAKLPSRKTLTRRLLPATIAELRASARATAKGHEATLQADGWTGVNNHHLLAFMITADGKVCIL